MTTQLAADSHGIIRGKFVIPPGVPSGSKLVSTVSASGTESAATFTGQGTLERQTFQQQTTVTTWQSPPAPTPTTNRGVDPLAETFTLERNAQASAIDLFFTKAPTTTTRVQLRGTTVGFPNQELIAEAIIEPHQVVMPPMVVSGQAVVELVGAGSYPVPIGVTSVSVTGRGTGGVAASAGSAPTYGSWVYAGVTPNNSLTGSLVLPFTTGNPPSTFSLSAPWTDGTESILFTRREWTVGSATYRGTHPDTGQFIFIRATRPTLTSGSTATAAQAGQASTFSFNGNNYSFPGAAVGVAAAPAETTHVISIPGLSVLNLVHNLPAGGQMVVTHNALSVGPGESTRIVLPSPVLLLAGTEYALVVLCDDPIGCLAVAELGKFDVVNQKWVTSQPYTIGVLLSSSNAVTWTAHQDRDMAFRILAAEYTAPARTIALGSVAVEDATDLVLMSYAERPASATDASYLLTLPDSSVLTVSDGQPVQLPAPITGNVQVSAVLSGTSDMAPVLFPGTQLASGVVKLSANYISRAVPAGAGVTIKVIFEALIPSGAAIAVSYKGIDVADAWAPVAVASTRNMDDGFVEFTHTIAGVTETAIQAQLVLTGTPASRPRARDLRIIVL